MKSIRYSTLFLTLFLVGCASLLVSRLDSLYGEEQVQGRLVAEAVAHPEFYQDVKPIVDKRCVVCHSCLDAPCQLKMSSFEGIDRGANQALVYDGARLLAESPTRMFEDATSTAEWRDKGFYPVLNERVQTPEANLDASTFYRALALKNKHPLPEQAILPDTFDFSLNRDQQCPNSDEYDQFEIDYPLWGMPYGLPALDKQEFETLESWLVSGAKSKTREALPEAYQKEIEAWEMFLNEQDLKTQLVARYIYEHLYLANIYFPDVEPIKNAEQRYFFKMVRSATATGLPVKVLATRRPFDKPQNDEFYYRIVPMKSTVVSKTHMPYRLDEQRRKKWQTLFFNDDYQVTELPGYESEDAANPFVTFAQLPVKSRYKFMLDEAQFTISGFIKGPVCRGQTALNVIDDHFWVVFTDPDHPLMEVIKDFQFDQREYLKLPAGDEGDFLGVLNWIKYSRLQHEYQQNRFTKINKTFPNGGYFTFDQIWDGDGENRNAALTVFRHFDNATVVKGHVGDVPKTVWVIPYTLLERIHYLLVSGFDVYGPVSHQLMTRLYMDFLRMEGETNFLLYLPKETQQEKLAFWYRDAEDHVKEYQELVVKRDSGTTGIHFKTNDPQKEFLMRLHQRMGSVVSPPDPINRPEKPETRKNKLYYLQQLAQLEGKSLDFLSEQIIIRLKTKSGKYEVYTLLRNLGHKNVSELFKEEKRIVPEEHNLTLVEGILGSHPNTFIELNEADLPDFISRLGSLDSEKAYANLLSDYAIRRTHKEFWAFSDWLHEYSADRTPLEYGVLDYNRLQNR